MGALGTAIPLGVLPSGSLVNGPEAEADAPVIKFTAEVTSEGGVSTRETALAVERDLAANRLASTWRKAAHASAWTCQICLVGPLVSLPPEESRNLALEDRSLGTTEKVEMEGQAFNRGGGFSGSSGAVFSPGPFHAVLPSVLHLQTAAKCSPPHGASPRWPMWQKLRRLEGSSGPVAEWPPALGCTVE